MTSINPADISILKGILDALIEDIDDTTSWAALGDWCIDHLSPTWGTWNRDQLDTIMGKAFVIGQCVPLTSPTHQGQCQCEAVTLHTSGYAEPGYSDPKCGVIATGNWNEITKWEDHYGRVVIDSTPTLLEKLLRYLGVPCEWSDKWSDCSNCGKLVRTQPDSMHWHPSYHAEDGELLCTDCYNDRQMKDVPDDEPDTGCILCGSNDIADDRMICQDCLDRGAPGND